MDNAQFSNEVISLTTLGDLGGEIQAAGIPVWPMSLTKNPLTLLLLPRIAGVIRRFKPDVIQTWMYHADLIGGVIGRLAARVPIVWGVHHASLDIERNKIATVATAKLCAYLSHRIPDRIVCCSMAAQKSHTKFGYLGQKIQFIPNGFDTETFQPDAATREAVRKELKIPAASVLITMVARFHPHKDHANFLRAAAILAREVPDVHFALCGADITWNNNALASHVYGTPAEGRVHFLGRREDVSRLLASTDIATSSSQTEAFPLAIGEAMASGAPCVVTDVGDSAQLVEDTGVVVPARNPTALAAGWRKLYEKGSSGRRQMGDAARRRIERRFSLTAITRQYQDLYASLTIH
jgi:glycosyltransferase involved in cell wall biosynthesis